MSLLIKLGRSVSPRTAIQCQQYRCFSKPADSGEVRIRGILQDKFPLAEQIEVEDISGGCGSMYHIHIESKEFAGIRKVKQHMMVNAALKQEIQSMHGLRINTAVPEE